MPIKVNYKSSTGFSVVDAILLNAVTATGNGEWINIEGFHPLSFQISGITTASVQFRGSNNPTKPADASDEFQLGSTVTADALVALDAPVKWLKAKVSAYTSGTISVYMVGAANA